MNAENAKKSFFIQLFRETLISKCLIKASIIKILVFKKVQVKDLLIISSPLKMMLYKVYYYVLK